jgi:hypothetical protein
LFEWEEMRGVEERGENIKDDGRRDQIFKLVLASSPDVFDPVRPSIISCPLLSSSPSLKNQQLGVWTPF